MSIIKEFEISLQNNKDSIRNPAAYLNGVGRRVTETVGEKIKKLAVTSH
jgi:hypothetical protein